MSDVLVVDDDPMIRGLLREALAIDGIPHRLADNGEAALREVDAQLPALVFLDINMPVLDGIGLCEALQQRGLRQHVAIVVMTAANEIARLAALCEAEATLPKPFDIDKFYEMLSRFGCAA